MPRMLARERKFIYRCPAVESELKVDVQWLGSGVYTIHTASLYIYIRMRVYDAPPKKIFLSSN